MSTIDSSDSTSPSFEQHIAMVVTGRVQGVGFRPFVYQLATKLKLKGSVRNTESGVKIHLQGRPGVLDEFECKLQLHAPVQARIHQIKTQSLALTKFDDFCILQSEGRATNELMTRFHQPKYSNQISPDIGVCDQCLAEFHDPNSRRYHDPFINCSDCGPRFTIMRALPYDREHSSMAAFTMCDKCAEEYQNPLNRRYHTQGICCPNCGPTVTLYDAEQLSLAEGEEALKQVAQLLEQGKIVAFKGMGGFHILSDATNVKAVQTLRERKRRKGKPFAVLCSSVEMARELVEMSAYEEALFNSEVSPIMLLPKKQQPSTRFTLVDDVAADTHRVGVFLAHTPLQTLLFKYFSKPLVATSANLSGEPLLYRKEGVFDQLCSGYQVVDAVLDYDREIENPCDDSISHSVLDMTTTILRLGRGLAPHYGELKHPKFPIGSVLKRHKRTKKKRPALLGVGAQQKSSVAFGYLEQWMLSPYIGDLHSLATQQRFEENFQRLNNLAHVPFNQVGCDAHPDYASTHWAESLAQEHNIELKTIAHHYAHVLACMAEFQLRDPVLAFCWDGAGYGNDGTIWGGEVLLSNPQEAYRVDHIKPFKLLGGELAAKQPRRVALSMLFDLMPLKMVLELELPTVQAFSEFEMHQLYKSHQQDINAPLTSSMGRVFDAVASLIGVLQITDYEGQSGLILESLYDATVTDAYDYKIISGQIDLMPMMWQLMEDIEKGRSQSEMASRFMNMLVNLIESISDRLSKFHVLLTGGVFQNKTLLELVCLRFENKEQELFFPQHTPINDGAIALGQVWWLLNQMPNDRQLI